VTVSCIYRQGCSNSRLCGELGACGQLRSRQGESPSGTTSESGLQQPRKPDESPALLTSKQIAMQAGSWFDRKDLTLEQRENAVAELIEAEIARRAGETAAVTRDTPVVREIFERHDRCSKLLWGPGSLPGMMLGPMDADQAHADRGTLLSLIPGPPRHPKTGSALPDRIMKEPQ